MKRLIRKAEDINTFDDIDTEQIVESPEEKMNGMVELDELSEADIRHDRCPTCKYNPLKREDGFKVCPRCENVYKVIDGNGYIIEKNL
ncbi:MAG: hypothetical protein ACOCRK_01400 [bacterium]